MSRPHQKGRGKRGIRGEIRIGRVPTRVGHAAYGRPPPPRRFPVRPMRHIGGRGAPPVAPFGSRGFKRPIAYKEKRPFMAVAERPRRLPPPERSYDRRPPPGEFPYSFSSDWLLLLFRVI